MSDDIRVHNAAIVICARQRPQKQPLLTRESVTGTANSNRANSASERLFKVFDHSESFEFKSGWEVLLGQAEVVNWIRSTPEKLTTMRYAGEWKLAGGVVDEGESIEDAARRELTEEFIEPLGLELPTDAVLRPFSVNQTKPVRSVSNLMHAFVALESENPWLANLDLVKMNEGLSSKRAHFATTCLQDNGLPHPSFFTKSTKEREALAPEVHQVQWHPLSSAVRMSLSSLVPSSRVNEYQDKLFTKYGRQHRDPMFLTGAILMDLETFPDDDSLIGYCNQVNFDAHREQAQWLFDGMNLEMAEEARNSRNIEGKTVFKSADEIEKLRSTRKSSL